MVYFETSSELSHQLTLGMSMLEQQQQGLNVDFSLSSGGKRILVHSLLIRNSCLMLKVLQDSPCSCSQPNGIILPQKYSSILPNFVSLLYTGSSILLKHMVPHLKELADLLGIDNLDLDDPKMKENVLSTESAVSQDQYENEDSTSDFQENIHLALKLGTDIARKNKESFILSLPQSRNARCFSNLKHIKPLQDFHGRIQEEYNRCPVGEYAGPYDLNEKLRLDILLPKSDLNYSSYSEFIHPDNVSCGEFFVRKNYESFNDLDKIDALDVLRQDERSTDDHFSDDEEQHLISDDEEQHRVYYTCKHRKCKIPCLCAPCCTIDGQCSEHNIKHVKLFDEKRHAVVIRSTEDFCKDETFFDESYIIKYAGIPLDCHPCKKDLLHHKIYHLAFHDDCKFCMQNWYKLFAKDKKELHEKEEKEETYYRSVCPHCDKRFCEPSAAKKHIEFEHNLAPFKCDPCAKTFHSRQAKEYHDTAEHSTAEVSEKCNMCGKLLASKISLRNHMKYVHSDERKYSCKSCDAKFKQKKSLKNHYLNVHNINQYKEMYHQPQNEKRYPCEKCGSSYKQKKDLNYHIQKKHAENNDQTVQSCDECPCKFKEKKSLLAHIKRQHGEPSEEFSCTKCGKRFNQKKNLNRHLMLHESQ